jgi:hypothetical protein
MSSLPVNLAAYEKAAEEIDEIFYQFLPLLGCEIPASDFAVTLLGLGSRVSEILLPEARPPIPPTEVNSCQLTSKTAIESTNIA